MPAPAGSVARRCPDIGRLRSLTGFAPKVGLEAGVKETFEWYRASCEREGARP
jgi:UDP-glucuronate decarboxylase